MKKAILCAVGCAAGIISLAQSVGIGTQNPNANTKLHVVTATGIGVYVTNSASNGYGLQAQATGATGYGVRGLAGAGTGVYGEAGSGTGVLGYGNDASSVAVYGSALAGIGVKAYSFSGKALEVLGPISISGGNTNPAAGAVLTSVDANGNAVWKNNRIGFRVKSSGNQIVADEATVVVVLDQEQFDPGNDFNTNAAASDKNTFIVPVSGFYHFDGYSRIDLPSTTANLQDGQIDIYVNGVSVEWRSNFGPDNSSTNSQMPMSINTSIHLNAGDKVTLRVYSNNFSSFDVKLYPSYFSGYLVFAD